MKKRFVATLLTCLLLLSGCGAKEEAPPAASVPASPPAVSAPAVSTPATEPTPEVEPIPEPPEPPYVPSGTNPLTGMPMEEVYEPLRPIAVMLNNSPDAQPQLGVSQADILYEMPAEGGIPRMMGVYQSVEGVALLGSVRSARPYFIEAALGHDALYVHAGGSDDAYIKLKEWSVARMDGVHGGNDALIFWRDAERKETLGYEHSLVTSGEKILDYLEGGPYRTSHKEGYSYPITFAEDGTPANGTSANKVTIKLSPYKTGTFQYDAETKQYLASQYGEAHIDGSTDEQAVFTNLLVLETDISPIPGDKEGRLDVRMTGTGKGQFFCGGKGTDIQWSKEGRSSPFTYTLSDGTPLSLGQGKTYVCVLSPQSSTVTVE